MSGIDDCTTCSPGEASSSNTQVQTSTKDDQQSLINSHEDKSTMAGSSFTNPSEAGPSSAANSSTASSRPRDTDTTPNVSSSASRAAAVIEQPQVRLEDIVPPPAVFPSVVIEFCDRCRWAPRASWIQTELFLTFPTPALRSITLLPLNSPETGGRFRVWVDKGEGAGQELVWDRKFEGGFPELKVLKQRIRNLVQPEKDLGHSDAHPKSSSQTTA